MLVFDKPQLFERAARHLLRHLSHKLSITACGGDAVPESIAVECEDCHECLMDFLPESTHSKRPDPEQVRYEGHYDSGRDVCYVEVFKPGKSPYPMQERQDIVNHSPTGIAWGYGGSGPAQCALALLLDYLGDEESARELYQGFKFKVVAAFPTNGQWTLTGTQIEKALTLLGRKRQESSAS